MPEYLEDPSVLTKEKLKTELLANNVELPAGGQPAKDVYVRLYLKHLTVQNQRSRAAAVQDTFSSDEELPPPPPPVSNRSRSSSSRKAMRKTVRTEDLDVTELTDENLKDELLKYGFDAGPIVASTRKLYEKKLQKLVDQGPAEAPAPEVVLTQIDIKHNGNSDSDRYSDKEEEITPVPEPEPEPEATPVVERPVRSRGKTPVTLRTHSGLHNREPDVGASMGKSATPPRPRPLLKGFPAELSPVLATRSPKLPNPPERLTRIDQLTFSPMCHISPVMDEGLSDSSLLTQYESVTSGCPAGKLDRTDVLLQMAKQQKISPFLSTLTPVTKTRGCIALVSKTPGPGEVEKIVAGDQTPRVEERDILKELFPNDLNTPTGISVTCRRPIHGAAARPVKSSDLWSNDSLLHLRTPTASNTTTSSSYTETRSVHRVTSLPPITSRSSSSRLVAAAPPAGQAKAARRGLSLWIKLILLATAVAFLFFVYQAMETDAINPFGGNPQIGGDGAAEQQVVGQ